MSVLRRQFLAAAGAASFTAAPGSLPATQIRESQSHDAITQRSTTALARAIRNKSLSSVEVVKAYLHSIDVLNGTLNANVQFDAEGAIEVTNGPAITRLR